uniref:Uncharacterized protein n=1 Tax=Sus scrofa TaxID=9823 RepID=A0A4X1SS32_PIG
FLTCHLYTFGEVSEFLLLLSFKSSVYILAISPLSDMYFANIFSQSSLACLSILLTVFSFKEQTYLILMKSNLSMFAFIDWTFGVLPKKILLNPRSQIFFFMFSSKNFIFYVLHLGL